MTNNLHSLIAPYALDALDDLERSGFERHLNECVSCQSELAGFVSTATRLGQVAELAPPAGLRDRLLAEVATTRQDRPIAVTSVQPSRLRRTLPRLVMAASFVLGALGVGGYLSVRNDAEDFRAQSETLTSIVAADDAKITTKKFDGGGHVRLVTSEKVASAVIVAKSLPGLPDGKVYQVWVVKDDSPRSEGIFASSGSMVMRDVDGADRIAITVEPKGGSEQPTTTPIATLAV